MPLKNEIYRVTVDNINNLGYGVCRIDGAVCFVKGGVTGDELSVKVIKVNKNYSIGRIEKILSPSDHRREQTCPVFPKCGGCTLRNIDYEYEKELKRDFVAAEFKKAGIEIKVNETVSANVTERYRNKAQYPVNLLNKVGFYSAHSHEVCDVSDCPLQPEIFGRIIEVIKSHMSAYRISGYDEEKGLGVVRHIYIRQAKKTGQIMVCLVVTRAEIRLEDTLVKKLTELDPKIVCICKNINAEKTNVILGNEYIFLTEREYIEDELCGLKFRLSPASFYQINRDCAELLYNKVYELVASGKCTRITDLYCGTGTIGLCVASRLKKCKLTGIDIVPEAIQNAKVNATLNDIKNALFFCADSSDTEEEVLKKSDVVIIDPPRKGITRELAEKLSDSGVKRIVYVSCSPDTLARDVKWLKELGYTCDEVTPFDMFPRTGHVETIVCLCKQ